MLLRDLVATSDAVAALTGRLAKIEEIAGLLRRATPAEVPLVVAFLSGELRQRQIGVGYAGLADLLRPAGPGEPRRAARDRGRAGPPAAATVRQAGSPVTAAAAGAPLTVAETDAVFASAGTLAGQGSQAARRELLAALFGRATAGERAFLGRLITGELRQGAQEGVMLEAVARAAGVPAAEVRRAHLLGGALPAVAQAALTAAGPDPGAAGRAAGAAPASSSPAVTALRSFGLRLGRPLQPMLASSAATLSAAMARVPAAALEWKIDGIRIQVHRDGDAVAVFTRTLDDITVRVPEITEAVLALGADGIVLDGEAVALRPDGRPRPFQVTAGRLGSQVDVPRLRAEVPLTAFFFDLLHLDGTDLIDLPASERHARLAGVLPPGLQIPRLVTEDLAAAEGFFADAVARGHEGVVLKSLDGRYAAGRRGSEWIKVKPRHTLDLVVLAAEWGHGRRRGWLSNLHLGARDPAAGGLVMLGKTFKGLTDQMLTWQTQRLLELADPAEARPDSDLRSAYGVLPVRPELVVEVAFDGVQASSRYPGGLALRFARVLRHRPDKPASEADTIAAVRALWTGDQEA